MTATTMIRTPADRKRCVPTRAIIVSRRKPERAENASPQGYQIRIVAMTRIGFVDAEFGLDPRGPVAENDDTGREQQRLFDVVGDKERGEAVALPQPDQFGLQR